jgi:transglutaminase-like putative cysteine protease
MSAASVVQYSVRHVTRFAYSVPISESIMEVRMQPRTDGSQHCLRFDLSTTPRARPFTYRDFTGNTVHHFDVPGRHTRLTVMAEALVAMSERHELPDALPTEAWQTLDAPQTRNLYVDELAPSRFARESALLREFSRELPLDRAQDPLTLLRRLTHAIFDAFAYTPHATRVDSPIDDALQSRAGVCQDFAHIMTTLVRGVGIPCRYVSGYLSPDAKSPDRSTASATHAWIEAWLPELGWIGFDPTNNVVADVRHIAVAIGRDYGDVAPTRGVFKGDAQSELAVSVVVTPANQGLRRDEPAAVTTWQPSDLPHDSDLEQAQQSQQQ